MLVCKLACCNVWVAVLTSTLTCRMQFVREFAKLGLTRSVGGVLALALSRELTPVVTCIILAGTLHQVLLAPAPLRERHLLMCKARCTSVSK